MSISFFDDFFMDVWHLVNEMSPYLLLGFLLAGVMHVFVPNDFYHKYLSKNNFKSVVYAALFGVPLPLCSCGVIPTAMGLRREGGSKGATVSFLIATPQTGVDSIIATYSLMGLPFAIIRPIVAMVTAILGGWLVNISDDELVVMAKQNVEVDTCACGHHHDDKHHHSFFRKIAEVFEYAFLEMMEDIGKWLVVGLLIAGLITAVVPDSWFAVFQGNSLLSILFVLLFSIPMYLCATGSIPIAVALMLKGLTPGAALVLLMAGPASNSASIMVVDKVLGRRTLLVYLFSIVSGAVIFGLGIDYLLPHEWFTSVLQVGHDCCDHGVETFNIICTVVLFLLLLNALSPYKLIGSHHHCHCHDHGQDEDHCHCHDHAHDEGHCHDHAHGEDHCHCHDKHCECVEEDEKTFSVAGMHCHHCADNVEKAISSVSGVKEVEVSLQEKTAVVRGTFVDDDVMAAIRSLGFDVEIKQ